MIKKYERDVGQNYLNNLELFVLFLIQEYYYSMSYVKLYNIESQEYNIRKLFWSGIMVSGIASFILLISMACMAILIKVFGF